MLFIVVDIEIIFLYPWAVEYYKLRVFGLVEMVSFVVTVLVAYASVWRRKLRPRLGADLGLECPNRTRWSRRPQLQRSSSWRGRRRCQPPVCLVRVQAGPASRNRTGLVTVRYVAVAHGEALVAERYPVPPPPSGSGSDPSRLRCSLALKARRDAQR